jgi:NADPH2:quinone reductase
MTGSWRIIASAAGGPEVLTRQEFDAPAPGPGEIRVAIEAVGVNFIDIYHRTGLYPRRYPSPLGQEAAGVVDAVGDDVDGIDVGTRVVFLADGSYATHITLPAAAAFILPDTLDSRTAAAVLLKGITAWMLAEGVRPVQPGMSVLVLAAAGGVGSLLVPWLKSLGATVIAHSGSAEKASLASAAGADHALHDPWDNLAARVRELTDGRGVDLVLDGVGRDSWAASLASTAKRGLIASYGNASGSVAPFAPSALAAAGSLFLTRPTLFDWIAEPAMRATAWSRLTTLLADGTIKPNIGLELPLADTAEAHRQLEARATTGSILLIP